MEHEAKNPPTQALPSSLKEQGAKIPPPRTLPTVRLVLPEPPAGPDEQKGKDMPMDVDMDPEVSALISGLAQINF